MTHKNLPYRVVLQRVQAQPRMGLAISTVSESMSSGKFPRQTQTTGRSICWLVNENDEWITSKITRTDIRSNLAGVGVAEHRPLLSELHSKSRITATTTETTADHQGGDL